MLPLSYRFERAGTIIRPVGSNSGWRRYGNTLMTQIHGGRCVLESESENYPIADGAGFLIPPGVKTRLVVRSQQDVTAVFSHTHCRVYELEGLFTVLRQPIIFTREQACQVGSCNESLIRLQDKGLSVSNSVKVSAVLARLVGVAVERIPELEGKWNNPRRERLLPVLRYMQNNLQNHISRPDLARVAGLSIPHLHTLFVREFGYAPLEKLRQERMQHARQLLHWSDMPIAEVGLQCGFEDAYYFSRAFKKYEGLTPTLYRKQIRRQC